MHFSLRSRLVGGRSAILAKLKNQKLMQFQNFERVTTPNMKGEPTEVVCGKVKIQNLSSGQLSARPFVYFIGDGTSYYDSGLPGADDLDEHIVKNYCVD